MNEHQPNFESLRRLLALKRHEVPPPGYFNNFSRQVIARIRAGETAAAVSWSERLFTQTPWLLRLLQGFETKPVFAGGFASVLCMLLLFGAVIAERPESASQNFVQPVMRGTSPLPLVAAVTAPIPPTALGQPVGQIMIDDNSTNPLINFASAPVGQMPSPQFLTFPVSGN